MKLKSRLLGICAAAVLILGATTGVMAQELQKSDTVGASVTLQQTYCSVYLEESNISFGDWKWNPQEERYVLADGGRNSQQIRGTLLSGKPGGTCNVTLTFDGLRDATGTIRIPHTSFALSVFGLEPRTMITPTFTVPEAPQMKSQTGTLTLTNVPNNIQPGTYDGTLRVEINKTN